MGIYDLRKSLENLQGAVSEGQGIERTIVHETDKEAAEYAASNRNESAINYLREKYNQEPSVSIKNGVKLKAKLAMKGKYK